jgi:NAD(P)-dependent dehydrogenase (short-subunit alcohol dehydrogenase family)
MQSTPLKLEQGIFALVSGNFHEAIRELLVVSREHVSRLSEPEGTQLSGPRTWVTFFEINVLSGVRLARRFLPAMKRANWGRILFTSSESAAPIPAEMIHYGMTKTA